MNNSKTHENPLWNDILDLAQALMPEPPCAALKRAIAKRAVKSATPDEREIAVTPNSALSLIRDRMGRALGWV